jgi:hypothetical protein
MIEIKDVLSRFRNVLLKEETKTNTIQKVLEDVVGISIEPKQITIKNHIIYLDIKPIYKSEIFLKQEEITSRLKEVFDQYIPDKLL